MRFNGLDLNLLVTLNALLTERSINRAAERMFLSQSAMSNALARLRDYFDDELLVPMGRQMVFTPRAESLVEPVCEVLMRIESTIATQPKFEPATESHQFTLLVSDYTTTMLLPPLIQNLYREAPGVKLKLLAQQERPVSLIERGDADLLIIPSHYASEGHPSQPLFEEGFACVTWEGNTQIRNRLTMDDYLAAGHVVTQFGVATRIPAFDGWFLEHQGITRRIEVTAPTFSVIPNLDVGTNRIATVHRRAAERERHRLPIRIWDVPIEIPRFVEVLQWHKQRSNDAALNWLRTCAIEVGSKI
jgi:LysR family transcriptional regulator, nod-box dependent transcriptional activator